MNRRILPGIGLVLLLAFGVGTVAASPAGISPDVKKVSKSLDKDIEHRLHKDASLKKYNVSVSVSGDVATLSGTVATDAQKARAGRLAHVKGIARVDNQLTVDKSAAAKGTTGEKMKAASRKTKEAGEKVVDKTKEAGGTVADKTKEGLSKTGEVITDAWITSRVKTRFIGEERLKGSDINVDTNDHVVTLKGTVMTEAGRAEALEIARKTEGVHHVVDHLTIGPKRKG